MSELPKRERVPEYHYASEQSKALIEALEDASAEAKAALEDVIDQFLIDTATWGLQYWEQTLGLSVDESKNAEYRRSRIKSKLRGAGVTTVAMIRNVAESFSNGEVDVLEYPGQFRLEIKFVGTTGTPPNMEDLTAALREIMPAHLRWDYMFVYNTWAAAGVLTWGEAASLTWDELKGSDLNA